MRTKKNFLHYFFLTEIILTLFLAGSLQAQQSSPNSEEKRNHYVFIGAGVGINDYGLGLLVEVPVIQGFSVYGNVGIGGWGSKFGGGISYYPKKVPYKSCFSVAYSLATGMESFETTLPIEPNGQSENVILDLKNAGTINLVYTYDIRLGNFSKLGLSTGYAIPLTKNAYEVKSPGITLNETSEKSLKLLQPGGLILGIRLMFGIGAR